MKSTRLTAALPLLVSLTLVPAAIAAPQITLTPADPLVKIWPDTIDVPFHDGQTHVARGEHASVQFALRADQSLTNIQVAMQDPTSGQATLSSASVGYIGYVLANRMAPRPAHDRLRPPRTLFPDPIFDVPPATLDPNITMPVWITVPIPADAPAGLYVGKATLSAKAGATPVCVEQPIAIRVYPVTVEKTRLWITNWWPSYRGTDNHWLSYLNEGQPVEPFSPKFWQLHRDLARTMAQYRQNVALISPLHLAQYQFEDGRWAIDFARFDQMVEIFIEEGVIGRIEGGHIGSRESDKWYEASPFQVYVPTLVDGAITFEKLAITDERARSFFRQYIPALVAHLQEKGWLGIYMQHIADEPVSENADTYIAIAQFIRELAPDLPLVDATLSHELAGLLHTWVPTLNGWHHNAAFYANRVKAGDELWFYTCVVPQGEYANRYIELPLIKTRLLHWINFKYCATGYLHWGFCKWQGEDPAKHASLRFPSGDDWIVYPASGAIRPSIRLEAMRDGIVDYELLSMLKERDPEAAGRLASQLVYDFNNYNTSVTEFRDTRRELLDLVSEPGP